MFANYFAVQLLPFRAEGSTAVAESADEPPGRAGFKADVTIFGNHATDMLRHFHPQGENTRLILHPASMDLPAGSMSAGAASVSRDFRLAFHAGDFGARRRV